MTKLEKAAYDKAYNANPTRRARDSSLAKTWYANNKEEMRAKTKAYKVTHRKAQQVWRKAHYVSHRKEKAAYYCAHREDVAVAARLRRYGLSATAFNDLLFGQGGVCKICGTPNWGKNGPHVDHNHVTGNVRGILCNRCNVALGMIGDDPSIARVMVDYLKEGRHDET